MSLRNKSGPLGRNLNSSKNGSPQRHGQPSIAKLICAPGGLFSTVMRSPEGQAFPNIGCYLEIIPNEKLVWTNAMEPGYRPAKPNPDDFVFTAFISLV